ncbi:hypothetical protein ACP4OV_014763 [Aristida adscensionis]
MIDWHSHWLVASSSQVYYISAAISFSQLKVILSGLHCIDLRSPAYGHPALAPSSALARPRTARSPTSEPAMAGRLASGCSACVCRGSTPGDGGRPGAHR